MDVLEHLSRSLADRYTVEREAGRGGMATVFLAHDLKHHRQVALKVLHPELSTAVGTERFLTEIRTAAGLQHPNILPLYDSGEADGLLFYVMPFVEGESLRDRLDREGELPLADALGIARDVGRGLEHAHREGVIHRDVKPANVLLYGDHAVVADFGIARALSRASGDGLTAPGLAVGTPTYMSPEQLEATDDADVRSDLYGLACVVYEMLAGEPPFTGSSRRSLAARHTLDPVPPLRSVRPTVPAEVERAIERALAKAPADRFPSVDAFLEALSRGDDGRIRAGEGSFFEELKRRRVYRAAALYGAVAFGVIQGAELTFPTLGLGRWAYDLVVILALAGFPVTLVLAWMYDITRKGVRRASTFGVFVRPAEAPEPGPWWRRVAWAPVLTMALVLGMVGAGVWAWWTYGRPDVAAGEGPAGAAAGTVTDTAAEVAEPTGPVVPEGMVRVAGGTYTVGWEGGRALDGPAHPVEMAPFAVESREVTVGEYARFVEETDAAPPWSGDPPPAELPVTGVFQPEASDYCAWRYDGGRLPTEAEWEAAARGKDGSLYPWGEEWRAGAANTASAARGGPVAVGAFDAPGTEVDDLIGNVWEWTRSPMVAYPGGEAPSGGQRYFVIRGGAYNTTDANAHAAYRGYLPPTTANRSDFAATGFRCVVPLPLPAPPAPPGRSGIRD